MYLCGRIMREKKHPWILPLGLGVLLLVSMLVAASIGVIPIPVKVRYYSMCPGCHGTAEMTKEEFNEAVRAAERRDA